MCHAEQVPQDTGCDAGQANQHGVVVEIVVGHVVNIGSSCEQFGAVVKADANRKRTRLSRTICGHASQEFSRTLRARAPYAVLSSTPGSVKPILRTVSKLTVALAIGECDYCQEQEPFQGKVRIRAALIN